MPRMSIYREPFKVEVHDETGLDHVYGRLRFAAATKLQPRAEIQEAKGLHRVEVAGLRIFIADHASTSAFQWQSDFNIVNGNVDKAEEKRVVGLINYPRLCKKIVMAKHLGLTIPKLKELLDGWGY